MNERPADLPLFPDAASTMAGRVDELYLFLVAVSALMTFLIFAAIIYFAVKYRAGSAADRSNPRHHSWPMETVWIIVPLVVFLSTFAWGAKLFYEGFTPPDDALEIYVVGKQWMWKIQHTNGKREINELHIPVNQPVKLIMTSEDVIHDFFVPAFRVKRDAVPGRYTTLWFEANRTGEFHLFCAEYCGTKHSAMGGRVVVMEPEAFENWIAGGVEGESMVDAGARLFERLGCQTCHRPGGQCPRMEGVFGSQVRITTGEDVLADESYIRESILQPNAKITAGYRPVMPTFQGRISETQLVQLVAYIKSLGQQEQAPGQEPPL